VWYGAGDRATCPDRWWAWASHRYRYLVRRVLHYDCDRNVRNDWIGRQLPSLLRQAGLVPCSIETRVVIFEPRLAASYFGAIARSATGEGVITEVEQRT
jgi:hypothetical protein